MRFLALLAFVVIVSLPGSAIAGNPWQLHCPATPTEQSTPAALGPAARGFFVWVRPTARSLRAGPIYLVALSSRGAISRDGDAVDSAGYYLHRAIIAISPKQLGTVTLTGGRLGATGARTVLGFATNGATRCTVRPPDVSCGSTRPLRFATTLRIAPQRGWRIVRTELRVGRTGCFRLVAEGRGLRVVVPFAVPGPDWGAPGW